MITTSVIDSNPSISSSKNQTLEIHIRINIKIKMTDNIPIEIQMEIMKRLPVKSLLQFRSVSKSWKSLIDSPPFIADYSACESRLQRLLISYEDHHYPEYQFESDQKFACIDDDDSFPQHRFPTTFPMSFDALKKLTPLGSSQGLFCLLGLYKYNESYREKAFLWNPAIRKCIAIDVPLPLQTCPNNLGFGVCPNTNDPMLVRIIRGYNDLLSSSVEVFTLSSKVWRSPRGHLPRKSIKLYRSQVTVGGFIYWQTYDGLIVSFDMATEEFATINLPSSFGTDRRLFSMSKIRDSPAVVERYTEQEKLVCAIWVMENGFPKSFTKLFTITKPFAWSLKVPGFRKNGEPILETKTRDYRKPAVLEVYESHTERIKDLGIYGKCASFFVMSYKESLLLLDHADNQHIKLLRL